MPKEIVPVDMDAHWAELIDPPVDVWAHVGRKDR